MLSFELGAAAGLQVQQDHPGPAAVGHPVDSGDAGGVGQGSGLDHQRDVVPDPFPPVGVGQPAMRQGGQAEPRIGDAECRVFHREHRRGHVDEVTFIRCDQTPGLFLAVLEHQLVNVTHVPNSTLDHPIMDEDCTGKQCGLW
ncbi:hypothetical protein [Azospirillum oleiclasticum]|uniref:hypothetical protein n=1 Tax=Azospirillum oleiclasticum TaxID=2735135 RepID=UPI001FE85589|nr:hypothetical protein [Azospirillum oleiclasticum]